MSSDAFKYLKVYMFDLHTELHHSQTSNLTFVNLSKLEQQQYKLTRNALLYFT